MKIKFIINILFIGAFICLGHTAVVYGNVHNRYDKKGRVYWHGPRSEKKVALTFDDGPSEDTLDILDTLKKFNIKATFFVVGKNVEEFPAIFQRIVKEGHALGNHSYSHPFMFINLPEQPSEQKK